MLDFDDAPVVPVLAGALHRVDRRTVKLHFNTAPMHQTVPGLGIAPAPQQDLYVMEGVVDGRLVRYESDDLSTAIDGFFQLVIDRRDGGSQVAGVTTTRRRHGRK